jgi:nitrogen fixation protein NifB
MTLDRSRHPCFDPSARHQFGRIHLPVAPACNVQCNFCDRKFDCLNESRPGVTSDVLTPTQALAYLRGVKKRIADIAVVGIAGPGDPFANADATMETLRLVRGDDPEILLCVATNGLRVGPYADELAALQVSHVTITINAVDPQIGQRIYAWMRDGTRVVRGLEAARLLLGRQLEAVQALKESGVTVKINTILIPGVNDTHVAEVARVVAGLGADVLNCIPLLPVAGTPFHDLGTPPPTVVAQARREAAAFLPQMSHCTRCRADAVGKLGDAPRAEIVALLHDCATGGGSARPHVAVASMEGLLVNMHLGEADDFLIFDAQGRHVATRPAPRAGLGPRRWLDLAATLHDCRAVLVSGAGETPCKTLAGAGVTVRLTEGLVTDALDAVYKGRSFAPPRRAIQCGEACSGQGNGCG